MNTQSQLQISQQEAQKIREKKNKEILLKRFKEFWEQKDKENPSSKLFNLCFKPMEPIDFCIYWVPKIWPEIDEIPRTSQERFYGNFRLASVTLLGWVLNKSDNCSDLWLKDKLNCDLVYKQHLRIVHIVWIIHFFTPLGFPDNLIPKLEKAFCPPSHKKI